MAERILLIDGDIIIYKHSWAGSSAIDWGDGVQSDTSDMEATMRFVDMALETARENARCVSIVLAFSSPSKDNFRKDFFPEYKAQRPKNGLPTLYMPLKEYLTSTRETRIKPRLEADDVLGILATRNPERYVIWSEDKDLDQVPGLHYRSKTKRVEKISTLDADRFFFQQVLTGDVADNYKGCPGVGPVGAIKKLKPLVNPKDMWREVVTLFLKHGKNEKDALIQAWVARILRNTDYDFEKKEAILWRPPGFART